MAVGDRNDPYLGFNFLIEIDQRIAGGFSEVTGLQVEVELQEYREGGVNEQLHRLAGPTKYGSNLVLKRGITDDAALWEWHREVRRGTFRRKNIAIVLLDSQRQEQRRWTVLQACPIRWEGPQFRAGTAEVAVETVEFVHRGFDPRD